MNEFDQNKHYQRSWITAVAEGGVAFFLVFSLLYIALGSFFPRIMDPGPGNPTSVYCDLCVIAIWLTSLSVAIWQVVSHRPRK